jgi:multimeric flavodoxin WrbA
MIKKIIGLSCGRKFGNSEFLLKAAAMGAEDMGVQTEIIRIFDLDVKHCTNCQACVKEFREGKPIRCAQKDDVDWILQKTLLDDCALILSGPVYHLRWNSMFAAINDRMLALTMAHEDVLKKTRVGAIISVGGAGPDWTNLGLLMANPFLQHTRKLVDQMQINDSPVVNSILCSHHAKSLERAKQLGRNVAKAMTQPIEDVKYMGEENKLACPVCHCNIFQVPDKLPEVVCPICWVHGTVESDGNQLSIRWNMEEASHPRFSVEGVAEHGKYIMNLARLEEKELKEDRVKELQKVYRTYGNIISPDKNKI